MKKITSTANPEVKRFALLNKSRQQRYAEESFPAEGLRLLRDAMLSSVKIEKLYFTSAACEKHEHELSELIAYADSACEISESVEARLSETKTPQGVFGLCKFKSAQLTAQDIIGGGKYVMLQNVQDPSNLGAAARTAEALGMSGLIIEGGCDIYSPKALRASMGAFFRLPIMLCADGSALIEKLGESGVLSFACVPNRGARDIRTLDLGACCVAVIGNEGNGITEELMEKCTLKVTVPMRGRAESLNASHAATIVMWEMIRDN